jgi:hypothetical protein
MGPNGSSTAILLSSGGLSTSVGVAKRPSPDEVMSPPANVL